MQQIEFIINNKRVVNYVKETNLLMLTIGSYTDNYIISNGYMPQ